MWRNVLSFIVFKRLPKAVIRVIGLLYMCLILTTCAKRKLTFYHMRQSTNPPPSLRNFIFGICTIQHKNSWNPHIYVPWIFRWFGTGPAIMNKKPKIPSAGLAPLQMINSLPGMRVNARDYINKELLSGLEGYTKSC